MWGKRRFVVEVLGFEVEVEVVDWFQFLTWGLVLFGMGYVICCTSEGYVIYGAGEGWGWLVVV
jgi:hypothetical protein